MSINPLGPLSVQELQEAIEAPYGQAASILRKHDPLWGKFPSDGTNIKWKVRLHQQVTMMGTAYVEASSEKEAEALAQMIDTDSVRFDTFIDADDAEVIDVEPA